MFSARPTRLFVIKFLGLWAGTTTTNTESDSNHNPKVEEGNYNSKVKSKHAQILQDTLSFSQTSNDKRSSDTIDYSQTKFAIEASTRKLQDLILERGIPGLTIAVSKRGQILWEAAFGYCDVENQLLCDTEALLRIASISKSLFAATVVGPLIEQKKINLNSSIHDYLSGEEFPRKFFEGKECDITIEQLLCHTSGIRHYIEGGPEHQHLNTIGSKGSKKIYQTQDQYDKVGFYQQKNFRGVIEALEPFKDEPLIGEPGKFTYTTYGYTLLSAVIEKIHQQQEKCLNEQIEDFWIETLRKHWGLKDTHLDQDEVILPRRARYYLRRSPEGGLINAPYTNNSVKWAGGGIVSNTRDLIRFGHLLINSYKGRKDSPLKKETIDQLWTVKENSYALGFVVRRIIDDNKKEKLIVHHSGGALGASSILVIYPESEIVVVILTNLGEIGLYSQALFIADKFEELN